MLVILGLAVALGAAIYHLRRRYLGVTVVGHSMLPTLHHGQRLLARRWRPGGASYRRLRRAEVIVFVPPAPDGPRFESDVGYRVKRVFAIAGDPAPSWLPTLADASASSVVPPHTVVVLGDNPRSEDSRTYGWVAEASIIGLVQNSKSMPANHVRSPTDSFLSEPKPSTLASDHSA